MRPAGRNRPLAMRARRAARVACLLLLAATHSGCEAPQPFATPPRGDASAEVDAARVPTRDDIVAIRQFWSQLPWLRRGERIVGFQATLYLISGETSRGAFAPGRIVAWLYEVPPGATTDEERKLLHVWELDSQQSLGYRVRREAVMGYHYGFVLTWEDQVEVSGKLVDIVFGYERLDGRVILGAPKRFRVPLGSAPRAAQGSTP